MKESPAIICRADIYRAALSHLEQTHPELNAVKYLSSRMNHSPQLIYAWCEGSSVPSLLDEENLFLLCDFCTGFEHKARFVFRLTRRDK